MRRRRAPLVAAAAGLAIVLTGCGDDGATDRGDAPEPGGASPSVVADATWCAGWQDLVAAQGQWVGDPSPERSADVLDAVERLDALGVPESLDPAGYTELGAVLDDVRASVDPSFTPSVAPSEPADVGHDAQDAAQAPFGAWLAEYCAG